MLAVNSLIQYGNDKNHVERVLWIDNKRTTSYVINIFLDRYPVLKSLPVIEEGIKNGVIQVVEEGQWFNPVCEETLSEKDREHLEFAWSIIEELADVRHEPNIFIPEFRKPMIQRVSRNFGISERTVGRYLKRYWQRGKTLYALVPDFSKCGGKGKPKTSGQSKRGRPRKYSQAEGINVTEEIEQIFRIALKKYYYTTKKAPLKFAYQKMIGEFFAKDYKIENGLKIPIIQDNNSIPTFTQFKYFYKKEHSIKREVSTRQSPKKYELLHRPVLGSATSEAIGPGSKYLLDGTTFDIYLCSRLNRNWVIGRPCLYYIQDVFSRLVTGIYVGLETSWLSAAMAIANSCEDKVTFCKQYGIDIQPDHWPSKHLPQTILGDRGELFSKEVESLVKNLHVKVENTSSYRGDLKGVLERHFRTTNDTVKMMLPGTINPDFRERGSRDYRLDAKLDLYQFTQIIIKCVLFHNSHYLASYNREEMMIGDDVEPIPIKMWEWGTRFRSGQLREVPKEIVLLNVLPTSEASVTFQGIRFQGLYYCSNYVLRERWLEKARHSGSWRLVISYDPRDMSIIYLRGVGEKGYEPCFLLSQYDHFRNKTRDEVEYLQTFENMQKAKHTAKELQSQIDLISEIEAIVKQAEKQTKEQQTPSSKAEKLRGIRTYRNIEKQVNRENEVFVLQNNKSEGRVIPINESVNLTDSDYFGDFDLLRRMQRERLNERDDSDT